jgi:hypothetical protein
MKKILLLVLITLNCSLGFSQTTCATAVALTTSGATTTFPTFTGTHVTTCLGTVAGIKAMWYKYTATANGEVTVSSDLAANNGTTYLNDTRVSIMKGTCTALTCYASNDDISGTNYKSTVTFPVATGVTYYIQWDNFWGAQTVAAGGTNTGTLGHQFTMTFVASSCIRPATTDFYLPDTYTTTSAKLYWNQSIGAPTNYDTDWSTTFATAAGAGTIVSTSTQFAGPPAYATSTVTGLPASSNFRYYVRGNCGATQSGWQGPYYGYLATTSPYTLTFDDATKNYTDGFVGFSRFASTATSNPPSYADGGVGSAMYTFNSTTAVSNLRAYTRGISLAAGEAVTLNYKTRLYSGATSDPMTFNITVGDSQTPAGQATVVQTATESSDTQYTTRTATWTAATAGVYYFGIHNNTPASVNQTFLFFDTLAFTSVLSTDSFVNNKFSVSPNPTTGLINVTNNDGITVNEITVTDLNGRVVKTTKFDNVANISINIADLSAGMYLMSIKSDAGIATKKIVKE